MQVEFCWNIWLVTRSHLACDPQPKRLVPPVSSCRERNQIHAPLKANQPLGEKTKGWLAD